MPPSTGAISTITLAVPDDFRLGPAVCSYGYFLLAPNRWMPEEQTLYRALRGRDGRVIRTAIREPRAGGKITIECGPRIERSERELILAQVRRMLRLDEDPANFAKWNKLNPRAKKAGFGRMFRSPTLFEDLVKTMTSCNVTWPITMRMNQMMTTHVGHGAFPTPAELAAWTQEDLKARCRVGYRADRILRLARDVRDGRLDLSRFENPATPTQELFTELKSIHGIGPYAAGNMCQLLGRYNRLPIDSETYRHFRQFHDVPTPKNRDSLHPMIQAHYAKFAPFQFLAYWFELWQTYQKRSGPATMWDAQRHGPNFTAANLE